MTTPRLKITKRIAELLADEFPPEGSTRTKIAAEVAAGRVDAAGAVMIEVDSGDVALLYGYALGSLSRIRAELAKGDPAATYKLHGDQTAWESLVRQLKPVVDEAAKAASAPPS